MTSTPVQDLIDELPVNAFQWRVLAMVAGVMLLDGFDVQLAAFAAPTILAEWEIGSAAIAPAMAASLFGMAFGTSIGGRMGDRFGRRPALTLAVACFGIMSACTALSASVTTFTILRFLTGLGLGAAVPNAAALVAEWAPLKIRNYAVAMISVGIPCGGIIGAGIVSYLIPAYGWQSAFLLGGILPLTLCCAMALGLPESPALLARKGNRDAQIEKLIKQAGGSADGPFAPPPELAANGSVLGKAIRRSTVGMAICFFAALMAVYGLLSWVPVILSEAGFSIEKAIQGSMLLNLTGVAATFLLTWLMLRIGSRATLIGTAILGIASLAYWAALLQARDAEQPMILFGLALTGATVLSLQALVFTLSTHVFPVECRSAGIGYTITIGRIGAILSAFGSGVILEHTHGVTLFLAAIGGALLLFLLGAMVVDRHISPGMLKWL